MNTQRTIEERLWDFIDGTASAAEKTLVDELIRTDRSWKEKYGELLEINRLLHASELEKPSMRFTKNVMEEIARLHIAPATQTYINKKIVWSILSFFILMIVGFLVYGFTRMQWSVPADSGLVKEVNKINFSRFFSNSYLNVLMMVNLVIGLFLLDHYLGKKRKQFQHKV
jgi:hypothetical protein